MRNLLAPKEPFFTTKQYERLSNILDNSGQVIFGVVVISPIFGNEQINNFSVILGMVVSLSIWTISILYARK